MTVPICLRRVCFSFILQDPFPKFLLLVLPVHPQLTLTVRSRITAIESILEILSREKITAEAQIAAANAAALAAAALGSGTKTGSVAIETICKK